MGRRAVSFVAIAAALAVLFWFVFPELRAFGLVESVVLGAVFVLLAFFTRQSARKNQQT